MSLVATILVLFVAAKMSIWTKRDLVQLALVYIMWETYWYIQGLASRVRVAKVWRQNTSLGQVPSAPLTSYVPAFKRKCYVRSYEQNGLRR